MVKDRDWRDFVVVYEEQNDLKNNELAICHKGTKTKNKIEVIFNKIDESQNGWLELEEFRTFIKELGVTMSENEFHHLIEKIDIDKSGKIDFEEFFHYYNTLLYKKPVDDEDDKVKDGLNQNKTLKRYDIQVQERKRQLKIQNVLRELQFKAAVEPGARLHSLIARNKHLIEQKSTETKFEDKLVEMFDNVEIEELSDFIADRWKCFTNFKRAGDDGKIVMTSDNDVTDALPGDYDLVELVMTQFGEIPGHKTPHRVILKSARWEKAVPSEKHGRLIAPADWDGFIPVEMATNQLLAYYGACFAGDKEEKVALLQRHGTVDFTYTNGYHEDFVIDTVGGNGIEMHAFHHMDCPLDDDSGFFVLGKYIGEELHLSAFKIPKNHVLYVPPNTIHSNDHLTGCWRTMLSDSKDAPIDHVLMYKESAEKDGECEIVDVKFHTGLFKQVVKSAITRYEHD